MCVYVHARARTDTHTYIHTAIQLKIISRVATTNIGTFSKVCNPQNKKTSKFEIILNI